MNILENVVQTMHCHHSTAPHTIITTQLYTIKTNHPQRIQKFDTSLRINNARENDIPIERVFGVFSSTH